MAACGCLRTYAQRMGADMQGTGSIAASVPTAR
jgi:hypothetical protein